LHYTPPFPYTNYRCSTIKVCDDCHINVFKEKYDIFIVDRVSNKRIVFLENWVKIAIKEKPCMGEGNGKEVK